MGLTIIGAGYVGLVAGACFADLGHRVVCVDSNGSKINELNDGNLPIYEAGLLELATKNVKAGRLSFTTDLAEGLRHASAVFIAVGTPPRPSDGHADLSQVFAVAKAVGAAACRDLVVVQKSTVPVGTGDDLERILRAANPEVNFSVVSNPEFLREGVAISDFMKPDRIVIGAEDDWGRGVVSALYQSFGVPIVLTSRRSAELLKYASNAFLATKITFMNEISDLCEAVGASVRDVAYGVGLDSRIGSKFLDSGPGYGGSCFPKDTLALSKIARDHRTQLSVVESVVRANENRKRAMALKVVDACNGSVRGKKVGVLGLAFKPNTDDMRESPAIALVQALQDFGAEVAAYDPQANRNAAGVLSDVRYCSDAYGVAEDADVVVLVTDWPEFSELDFGRLRRKMKSSVLVDFRNLLDERELVSSGFEYWGLGNRKTGPLKSAVAAE